MTMRTSRFLVVISVAATLAVVPGVVRSASGQTDSEGVLLVQAFAGIQGFEMELNHRFADGSYRAQSESDENLDTRITPFVVDDMLAVQGLGLATLDLGYAPTITSRAQFAAALRANQGFFSTLDPGGTADLLHEFISGTVRGNLAVLLLNFGWYGSLVDGNGDRVPIALPLSTGIAPVNGRCMFVLGRVNEEWKVLSFFVVVNPTELQF